jgi:hypothetical protein
VLANGSRASPDAKIMEWSLKVIRAEGLPKPDAIVVVSNGGVHLAQVPSQPDSPESMKKSAKGSKGTEPLWEEIFIFPATMTLQDEGSNDVLTRTLTRTRVTTHHTRDLLNKKVVWE